MRSPRPVIFLDIDGVLNHAEYLYKLDSKKRGRNGEGDHYMLDPIACGRLERIIRSTEAVLVISSSWRHGHTHENIEAMLRMRGVPSAIVIGATPARADPPEGIQAWLTEFSRVRGGPFDLFAILDDDSDMAHLLPRLVKTSWESGLLDVHVKRVCSMLGRGQ